MKPGARIVVFVGPSLPPDERPADPVFDWRPPAMAGDGLALCQEPPKAVVLIDGLFDEQPSIRHKELLSLIGQGVAVIGGASMGALRASELHTFGMIGVGQIFEAYVRGYLVGDDEVAVLHGPADWDWRALTEPLVNVRATVLRAVRELAIDVDSARVVLRTAQDIFYKQRTWPSVLAALTLDSARIEVLRDWLVAGRVDLKRKDAFACLHTARSIDFATLLPRASPPQTLYSDALAAQIRRS